MFAASDHVRALNLAELLPNQVEVQRQVYKKPAGSSLLHKHFNEPVSGEQKKTLVRQVIGYLQDKSADETYSFFHRVADGQGKYQWRLTVNRLHTHVKKGMHELVMFTYELDTLGELTTRLYRVLENEHFFRENLSKFSLLTKKEKEILQLLSQGMSSREIAISKNTSIHTVNTHRKKLREKLAITSPADLIKYAETFEWSQNTG